MGNRIHIFGYHCLQEIFDRRLLRLEEHISSEADDYILNVNETEYLNFLVHTYSVDNLELDFEKSHVRVHDSGIGVPYTQENEVITYCIPRKGEDDLVYFYPETRSEWTIEVAVEPDFVCFDIIYDPNKKEQLQREIDDKLLKIKAMSEKVRKKVTQYNASLPEQAFSLFYSQKNYILEKYDLIKALRVPIYKRTNLPQTFVVPTPATRKEIHIKPVVTEKGYIPEPTLDQSTYENILQYIHDWGRQFERLPSTYRGKEEQDLRDLFLLLLEPHFVGTATGETFNKGGKTDVLLRYEGKNVFVAEFKIWEGQKEYLKAINQLLRYLTFRDSKAAVVFFVRNKNISRIFKIIKEMTPTHSNYLGFIDKRDESWFNYRFHVEGDRNREIRIAVLLFHIPEDVR